MSLAAAIAVAHKAAARVDGTKVKLRRGESETECVPALRGSTRFETLSTENPNVVVTTISQDFLIATADYDFGDGPAEPARGDLIILVEPTGNEHTYELLDLPDQKYWRWSDPFKTRLRLHTKESPNA